MTNTFLKIINKLEKAGHKAYLVGGCVRDKLLEKIPNDIDITTSATPSETENIFEHTIPSGKKFGTITVIMDNKSYEVTTFRTDGTYSNSRRPDKVTFTSDITEDLSRRDFTINAMAIDKDGNIIDPFGGQTDLEAKTVKCVGNPRKRFEEDALRMMRAVRFATTLDFRIESKTFDAIKKHSRNITNVSWERIRDEFNKIITSNNPGYGINILTTTSLIQHILPEFVPCMGFEQYSPHHSLDVYNHIITVLNSTQPKLALRLAALFHDIAKPLCFTMDDNGIGHFHGHEKRSAEMALDVMQRMKYSNAEIGQVLTLVLNHMERTSGISPAKLLQKVGPDLIYDLFELERADVLGTAGNIHQELTQIAEKELAVRKLIQQKPALTVKDLAITGYDLMQLGIQPGKKMGMILNTLLETVLDCPNKNNKAYLIKKAQDMVITC